MVKITDDPTIKPIGPNTSKAKPKASGPGFAQKLSQATSKELGKPSAASNGDPTAAVSQTVSAGEITTTELTRPMGQVEKTLGKLDEYTKALADPGQSLKKVSILVEELEEQADTLNKSSQSLPEGHAVRDLMDRTAVVATVEAIKFKRGDYV